MHYFSLRGAHYEMGLEQGEFFRRSHIAFPLRLDGFQLEHGRRSEALLRKFFPEVCEEIRGVSDSLGEDYLQFASWMLCMGCCMYNLEENIPREVRGCTAFACAGDGGVLYGRNNDLPPYLREGSKSVLYAPENGYRFYMATSSFINGEEGMNEHGLAAAMTFVMTDLKKIQAGLNSCFIVRYLLEKADSTKEAIARLWELPIASNCNILLADKKGVMAVAECTPDRKRIREAENFCNNKVICTVNSFISDEMNPCDDAKGRDYEARKRYEVVMDSFASGRARENAVETVQALLKGDYGFLCQYDDQPDFETVWSSVFDLESLAVYHTEGDPRKYKFLSDDRLQASS